LKAALREVTLKIKLDLSLV